ncbi:hypothetical protein MCOR25_010290 [Pyricularia grisea]|uniref:Uncharacterized protein n=1 Tax=Pyricularia grisea TaxID=148305 RepID=A0A6P8B895_PYRGI|nr:uncharacterized protein PgNI_03548 [Pyricularia grisea]KAI6350920.1 hypothetical protein MCOR25_010290 [Pyricularia grisea]TLD12001.1 hypothetical protein PgNI_03548 [Pyricularia grisea]
MSHFFAAIEDLVKSVANLFAGIFNTIANVIGGFLTMIVNFFSSFVNLITGTVEGLAQMVGGLGKFIAGNIVLIGIVGVAVVGYQRFVVQGNQPKPITQAKKTT